MTAFALLGMEKSANAFTRAVQKGLVTDKGLRSVLHRYFGSGLLSAEKMPQQQRMINDSITEFRSAITPQPAYLRRFGDGSIAFSNGPNAQFPKPVMAGAIGNVQFWRNKILPKVVDQNTPGKFSPQTMRRMEENYAFPASYQKRPRVYTAAEGKDTMQFHDVASGGASYAPTNNSVFVSKSQPSTQPNSTMWSSGNDRAIVRRHELGHWMSNRHAGQDIAAHRAESTRMLNRLRSIDPSMHKFMNSRPEGMEELLGHYRAAQGPGLIAQRVRQATANNWSSLAARRASTYGDPAFTSAVEHLQRNYGFPGGMRTGRYLP